MYEDAEKASTRICQSVKMQMVTKKDPCHLGGDLAIFTD